MENVNGSFNEIEQLSEGDFVLFRYDNPYPNLGGDHRNFIDETLKEEGDAKDSIVPDITIENFKQRLKETYLPFFTAKFSEYLSFDPDFFVFDGTSAIPAAVMFKQAFRTYMKRFPGELTRQPLFLFMDAHELRDNLSGDENIRSDTLNNLEFQNILKTNDITSIREGKAIIDKHPQPKILVFTEYSSFTPNSSVFLLSRTLNPHGHIKVDTLVPPGDSKEFQQSSHVDTERHPYYASDLFVSNYIFNPIKRRSDIIGRNIQRPSKVSMPVAHKLGLEYLRECQRFGALVGNAVVK